MGKINVTRLILGGIVAGIAIDLLDYLVDGVWLAQRWADGMALLGKPGFSQVQIIWFNVLGLLTGLAAIWLYAAIRPRFGAGPKTAIIAGVAVWFIGVFLPNVGFMYVPRVCFRITSRSTRRSAGLLKSFLAPLPEHRSTGKA